MRAIRQPNIAAIIVAGFMLICGLGQTQVRAQSHGGIENNEVPYYENYHPKYQIQQQQAEANRLAEQQRQRDAAAKADADAQLRKAQQAADARAADARAADARRAAAKRAAAERAVEKERQVALAKKKESSRLTDKALTEIGSFMGGKDPQPDSPPVPEASFMGGDAASDDSAANGNRPPTSEPGSENASKVSGNLTRRPPAVDPDGFLNEAFLADQAAKPPRVGKPPIVDNEGFLNEDVVAARAAAALAAGQESETYRQLLAAAAASRAGNTPAGGGQERSADYRNQLEKWEKGPDPIAERAGKTPRSQSTRPVLLPDGTVMTSAEVNKIGDDAYLKAIGSPNAPK